MENGRRNEGNTRERLLAEAGWGPVQDRVLSGLLHDLRGRATAFAGLGQLLSAGDGSAEWFGEHLEAEVERLQEILELMGLLPARPREDPEPLSLGEALPTTLRLWARASGNPLPVELEHDGSAPPVRVRWSDLRRGVLLLLALLDEAGREQGMGAVGMRLAGEGHDAVISFTLVGEGPGDGDGDTIPGTMSGVDRLRPVWESLGGELVAREGAGPTVRLPGLSTPT